MQAQEPDPLNPRRFRAFLAGLGGVGVGVVRGLIGLLGVGGFVVGVIVAWSNSSSTTLLIASAVLLLFAAVGLDWNEILASLGSASVTLRRGLGVNEELERGEAGLEQVAAREEAEPVRDDWEALRLQRGTLAL